MSRLATSTLGGKRFSRELNLTAFHEGGHAVVGLVLGLPISGIAILDSSFASGVAVGACWDGDVSMSEIQYLAHNRGEFTLASLPGPTALEAYLVMLAAGRQAQAAASGQDADTGNWDDGSWDDRLVAEQLSGELLGESGYSPVVQEWLLRVDRIAAAHVHLEWGWISRVATNLKRRRWLSGQDIVGLQRPMKPAANAHILRSLRRPPNRRAAVTPAVLPARSRVSWSAAP